MITKGFAFINGGFVNSNADLGILRATLVHEFGHFLNLAHTQVNGFAFFTNKDIQGFGRPAGSRTETMYPILLNVNQETPHADDISTLSFI